MNSPPTAQSAMTDFASKGLLPQLTDLLNALAGSQRLLMQAVRDARLQTASSEVSPRADLESRPTSVGHSDDTGSAHRDYNFFDELDVRLAGLDSSAGGC